MNLSRSMVLATFNECWGTVLLQAAFLIGEQGNSFCEEVFSYYKQRHFFIARWFFRHVDLSQNNGDGC